MQDMNEVIHPHARTRQPRWSRAGWNKSSLFHHLRSKYLNAHAFGIVREGCLVGTNDSRPCDQIFLDDGGFGVLERVRRVVDLAAIEPAAPGCVQDVTLDEEQFQ